MKISIRELEALVKKTLLTQYSKEHAALITDVVMFGELEVNGDMIEKINNIIAL